MLLLPVWFVKSETPNKLLILILGVDAEELEGAGEVGETLGFCPNKFAPKD
jgi:hypothetical protein